MDAELCGSLLALAPTPRYGCASFRRQKQKNVSVLVILAKMMRLSSHFHEVLIGHTIPGLAFSD